MILYSFQCNDCQKEFDALRPLKKCNIPSICPDCGSKKTKRIITNGGVQRDEPAWLASAVRQIQPEGERTITNRTQFNRFLKERQIVQH